MSGAALTSAREPVLALAATPRDWAQRLHRHLADHGGARVRATVLSVTEAVAEQYDVLIVDDSTSFLSARLVEMVRRDGRQVLGLFDPQDPQGKGDLVDCGVDEVAPCDVSAADLIAMVRRMTGAARPSATAPGAVMPPAATPSPVPAAAPIGLDHAPHPPVPALGLTGRLALAGQALLAAPVEQVTAARGRVVVVTAAAGGSGCTEVALGLAMALRDGRRKVALVELDEYGATLAPRLGLAPYPNLRAALERARKGPGESLSALQPLGDGVAALVAGPVTKAGSPPPADEITTLIDDLRAWADWVVVDAGSSVRTPVRSDHLVVVGSETPAGVLRLSRWLRNRRRPEPVHVVVSRCSGSTFRRYEVAAELGRAAIPASLTTVPEDERVRDATWRGRPVDRGPFTKAMRRLAEVLVAEYAAAPANGGVAGATPHPGAGTPPPGAAWPEAASWPEGATWPGAAS